MALPPEKQADIYAWHCALMLDALRRRPRDQHAAVLKHDAWTLYNAAIRGDANLFKGVGRLLSKAWKSNYLKRFEYSHAMLSRWLADTYWLMPAKLVSSLLARGLCVEDNLNRFLADKTRYGLKSHTPTLIAHFEKIDANTEKTILTKDGEKLLGRSG
jgi:hypothetical protein